MAPVKTPVEIMKVYGEYSFYIAVNNKPIGREFNSETDALLVGDWLKENIETIKSAIRESR